MKAARPRPSPKRSGGWGGGAKTKKIASKLRFDTKDGASITPEEVAFGLEVRRYCQRWRVAYPTCAQILDAAMSMGYRPKDEADFETLVRRFQRTLHDYKRREKKPVPLLSEVLGVLKRCGYRLTGKPAA